jgi:thiamine biosynthesis lipoprotein
VQPWRATHRCMGTMASLHVHDAAAETTLRAAADATFAELDRLEAIFSTFRPDSEISRVNRGELHLLDCSPEVVDVLDACTWLEHATGGAFSSHPPHRPGKIDPAGFVKGWAAERATRMLLDADLEHWYLSVGGDIQTHGRPRDGGQWSFALADPLQPGDIVGTLAIDDGAVATSGTAERGRHLWDGRDGRRAAGLSSLTVTGPHLAWADALATAGFAMGEEGIEWVSRFDDYHAVAVTLDGVLVADPVLAAHAAA